MPSIVCLNLFVYRQNEDTLTISLHYFYLACNDLHEFLFRYPVLTIQQALNDPSSQQVIYGAAQCSSKRGVVQWMNKPIASLSIKRTINFNEVITFFDLNITPLNGYFLCVADHAACKYSYEVLVG